MENCILHEAKLNKLESDMALISKHLESLLERDNDFLVKVINGRTEERLASELIGEMYVNMKHLQSQTPKSMWKGLGNSLMPLLNILTIIGLIITMIQVFK